MSGISGLKTVASHGSYDYWVVKIGSTGLIEWQKSIGGNDDDYGRSLQQTLDGGFIIGGISISDISGDKSEPSFGAGDYWVVKLFCESPLPYYADADGDGYGDLDVSLLACALPTGYVENDQDCDDGNILINPDAIEICDGIDNNCDGNIDEGIVETISMVAGGPTTFCQGGSVDLTATHSGTSLQWKRNAVNIPGATGTTYIATKTGNYTCVTTSPCGTTTSDIINVIVNKNPNASITAGGPTTFCEGGNVVLSVAPVGGSSYQWYKGAAIAGATGTNYIATTAGNYKCRVTKTATGCFKNSNVISVSVPCREDNYAGNNFFTLYPNPAFDNITLETIYNTEKTIFLMNALGQILQSINTTENSITINLTNIPSGVYFIKMEDGINSVTEKFVKQ